MNRPIKIALIDVIGLCYCGDTTAKRGLGGSESAVVYMAKELAALPLYPGSQEKAFSVTVFNNCIDSLAEEGIYDEVNYVDLSRLHSFNGYTCDVMIGLRTVIPFLPKKYWNDFNYPAEVFQTLRSSAKFRAIWTHDTFVSGDHLLEELVHEGHIDEIFTLSDFHTTYITNCHHGGERRNYEVLKNKVFQTRNGANQWLPEVDLSQKDPNHFIYNAAITKGMLPLVHDVWPLLKKRIPQARLTVIGGYYRFRDGAAPDAQEVEWHKLANRPENAELDITFTGLLPQKEIATHLANASFMLYPAAFPETFGISTLESMLYNTPLITNRFGALEETAVDLASYKLDYAIEPNNLFPAISKEDQVSKFVDLAYNAWSNPYLLHQKQQYCNIVKPIAGWDTVALQWKQHLYKKLGLYLPVEEYRRVDDINREVHRVYGRRFSNPEEWGNRKYPETTRFHVLIPAYNCENYIRDTILSVAAQDYENYTVTIVEDCGTDMTRDTIRQTVNSLPKDIQEKFHYDLNNENKGSVENYYDMMKMTHYYENDVIIMLDGDDKLANDPTIFDYYNKLYRDGIEFTYGSAWSMADNIPLVAGPYPERVFFEGSFRHYKGFPWGIPYTHLRTFKGQLFSKVTKNGSDSSAFKDENGKFFRAGGDNAFFFNIIEQLVQDPEKIKAVPHIHYLYNDLNPLNDYKVNNEEQDRTAAYIRSRS